MEKTLRGLTVSHEERRKRRKGERAIVLGIVMCIVLGMVLGMVLGIRFGAWRLPRGEKTSRRGSGDRQWAYEDECMAGWERLRLLRSAWLSRGLRPLRSLENGALKPRN
jgi:hypothetical protein